MLELFKRDRKFVNLFNDDKIKKYKTLFFIDGEESLSNCWLHFSAHGNLENGEILAFLSSLYYLIDFFETEYKLNSDEYEFHILVEESENYIYFTIPSYYLVHIVNENDLLFTEFNSKIKDNIVSFRISIQDQINNKRNLFKKELKTYDFIRKNDLVDLQELSSKLTLDLLEILEFGFTRDSLNDFTLTLFRFSKIIKEYSEIERISDEIEDFIFLLKTHIDEATNLEMEYLALFEILVNHINLWLKKSFFSGIESLEYYNNKINKDIDNIRKALIPEEMLIGDL